MIVALGLAVGAVVAAFVLLGNAPASRPGQLAVAVHDAPCTECSHVWVTFTSVDVHQANVSGSGWSTINVSGSTVDLMALNGTAFAKVIGVASLSTGHYEQVRLTVSSVVVELTNGTTVNAVISGATSAAVHGSFDVAAGVTTTISIDIDLASSLHVVTNLGAVMAIFTPNIGGFVVVA